MHGEKTVRHTWLGSCLLTIVACTNGQFRVSGKHESARAPATAMIPRADSHPDDETSTEWVVDEALTEVKSSDTTSVAADSTTDFQGWVEREQPGVVLRCEGGQLGAYLITTPSGEGQDGTAPGQEVKIALDSAPGC
jgi:hypothetical protein